MASLLSPRRSAERSRGPIALQVVESVPDAAAEAGQPDPISWPVAAVLGGLCTAAVGWILVAGLVACGWLMSDAFDFGQALELGTRLWLLACGVSVRVGTLPVTLVPWGLTAVSVYLVYRFGGYAARRVRPDQDTAAATVAAVLVLSVVAPVAAGAAVLGEPARAPGHALGVAVVLFGAAFTGVSRAFDPPPTSRWPHWLRGFPAALGGAQLVLLGSGVAVLVVGLVANSARVEALTRSLEPGVAGGVLLVLVQVAVVPNAVVWSGSYALGAGFSLGNGSVVAPAATQLGVLPGVPLLGALPSAGPGGAVQLWWLTAGALAGAVAAWLALRGGAGSRFDQASLLGGLSGLSAAAAFVGLAWLTGGDLGAVRLAGLGPRLLPLLVMTTTTLGLSGMLTGALIGLLRRRS